MHSIESQSGNGADDGDPSAYRERLQAIYGELDAEVAALAPVCVLSGRCCRFEEYGHTLFLSAPEFHLLLADAPQPSRPVDSGATCPWQDLAGRCTAREARPLGCRVYFCDPAYEPKAYELTEPSLAKIRDMVVELGLSWDYAPLHRHLAVTVADGRIPGETGPSDTDDPPAMPQSRIQVGP